MCSFRPGRFGSELFGFVHTRSGCHAPRAAAGHWRVCEQRVLWCGGVCLVIFGCKEPRLDECGLVRSPIASPLGAAGGGV